MSNTRQVDTSCIIARDSTKLWRITSDRNIYFSFDLDLYIKSYDSPELRTHLLSLNTLKPMDADVQERYSEILLREWGERAQMPIKKLPSTATAEFVRSRNVFFIVGRTHAKRANPKLDYITYSFSNPENGNYVYSKIILLFYQPLKAMTNKNIYLMLHESAHVFEEKHFSSVSGSPETDEPPFCKLDCKLHSVMAYGPDCYPVIRALRAVPREVAIQYPHNADKMPADAVAKIEAAYPTELAPWDLEAAAEVRKRWKERRASKDSIKNTEMKCENGACTKAQAYESRYSFVSILRSLNATVDYAIEQMQRYAEQVGKDCPSYFPEDSRNYWSGVNKNQHQFFQVNSESSNATAALPSSNIGYLK